ncbi:hypothetical protein [Staphylococcus pasteuri]|uniref:hypothetical protein n=1 Tax=Staphylococcus pasteuri TaxID=45972 RepID=UPI0036F8C4C7
MTEIHPITIPDILRALHSGNPTHFGQLKRHQLHSQFEDQGPGYSAEVDRAVRGALDLGLVTIDEESWHEDVCLTADGRAWTPDSELPEIVYVYLVEGQMTLGTLADWAEVWRDSHYAPIEIPPLLRTWENFDPGHPIHVERLGAGENNSLNYRITAAGEQVHISIDGDA